MEKRIEFWERKRWREENEGNGYKIRVRARIEGRNTICEDRGKEQGTGEELQKSAARKERGNNSNSNILTARQAKSR